MFTTKNLLTFIIKNILISLTVIVIAIFIILFFKKEIENISDSIALNNKIKSELKKKAESFSIIENDVRMIGNSYIKIEEAFIPSNDIGLFMSALDMITPSKTKQIYKFETPVETTGNEYIKVSLISYSNNTTLNIEDFSEYLKKFEDLPYFTKIESLNISSQSKNGWNDLSNINFKAVLATRTIN